MKYIIEIEEEPLVRKSALHGEDAVYRAAGFKSLVFDKVGLEKLTPYCPANDESSYEQGIHDAWSLVQEIDNFNMKDYEEVFDNMEFRLSSFSYDDTFERVQKYKAKRHKQELEQKMIDDFCNKTGYSISELSEIIERYQG